MATDTDNHPGDNHPSDKSRGAKDRLRDVRIWYGMCLPGWMKLLIANRFAVTPRRMAMATMITPVSAYNSAMWLLQELLYGRKIRQTELAEDPIFVIGHWRSGTTLLHELLVSDPRFAFPNTYACFLPNHFVLTERWTAWFLKPLLPKRRPMDDMVVTWKHPQEEEWALCNMGIPSYYQTMAFPNHEPQGQDYLDLRSLSPDERKRWENALHWFLRCVAFRNENRQIVLKTPQHTCRIRTLVDMFPNARFVHIVRDPYVLFPSTMKTWKRFYKYHGLQVPRYEGLEEHVLKTLVRMYEVFDEDRSLVDPSRFCEVRYESLVKDPIAQMRRVYESLELGDIAPAIPKLQQYVERTSDYQPNRYQLEPSIHDEITRRWAWYLDEYDYSSKPEAS